jgi:hypothetical protein
MRAGMHKKSGSLGEGASTPTYCMPQTALQERNILGFTGYSLLFNIDFAPIFFKIV